MRANLSKLLELYKSEAVIYFHWPYCLNLCTYCNFNKYVQKDNGDPERQENNLKNSLIKEADTLIKLSNVQHIKSIYFGGGTPSLVKPSTVKEILSSIRKIANVESNVPVSLECNPSSPEVIKKLPEFKSAGITRVSVGLQSLNNESLLKLGRDHSAEQGVTLFKEAQKTFGHENVSLDVLFARPYQSLAEFSAELQNIALLRPSHVSLYQLTPERGTQLFKQLQTGELRLPSEDEKASMYETAVDLFEAEGLERYEVSNFAKPGSESIHNLCYWNGTQYVGIGPGAHGRFFTKETAQRESRIQILDPKLWMKEISEKGHGTRLRKSQEMVEILSELLATSLRTKKGVETSRWRIFSSVDLSEVFGQRSELAKYFDLDLLRWDDESNLQATKKGLSLVDSILPDLLNVLYKCKQITAL